ncbi:MAG: glycine oxidase ThiO [Actinobacteria bacterium]|nr:glycine oxidase ThiO [Actinomycetota bacterium]
MKVVVVGGGAIGLSIAWRAAGRGLTVTVIDPEPGRGASGVAAGMLAPVTEVHYGEEDLLALNLESARRYPEFVAGLEAASGVETGYRACGTVAVARDADDLAALEELVAYQRSLGLEVERLRSSELRRLEPGLAPGVRGGALVTGDHQVDPRRLTSALVAACRRSGVVLRAERAVAVEACSVTSEGGAVDHGDAVVLAAGAWSGALDGVPAEVRRAVRPVKGQVLRLRGPGEPPISRNVRGAEAYLVPRHDGEVVVGATVEERGFDTVVTGGAVHELLRAAIELVPDVAELALVETAAGLRPGTPDNAPLIGATASEGLVVAGGHYRNGILLAPVTADAVAELLATGVAPPEITAFSPQRFERVLS